MDRNVHRTVLDTKDNNEQNNTAMISLPLNGLDAIWTKTNIFHVSILSLLMLLTLLGNVTVIITIVSHAELRKKRVNIFILNLAVGYLMVCFASIPTHILYRILDRWVLGAVACKLLVYCLSVSLVSTTLLLTAISVDKYQVVALFLPFLPRIFSTQYLLGIF